MPRKVSFTLLAVILAGLAVFGAVRLFQFVTTEHDGWGLFSPVTVTTEPLVVEPQNLFTREELDEIEKIVTEAHAYGTPWSIRVIRTPRDADNLSAQELAEERYAEQPVETADGAGDGLLMLVAVPIGDPTAAEVGFASGPNFYPRGGITPERLQEIVDVQMARAIEENRIGAAVIEGATWVEWTHLFRRVPASEPTQLERGLRALLEPLGAIAFAGLGAAVYIAAIAVLFVTRRGTGAVPGPGPLDGVMAAAVERGRVDWPVVMGAMLDAVDRGVLAIGSDGTVRPGPVAPRGDRERILIQTLGDRRLPARTLARELRGRGLLSRAIEDALAATGAFHPKSPVLTLWLRWIAVGGLLLGALGLVLSVLSSARYALAAALALTVISLAVALWNERRSWSTRAGGRVVAAWRELHRDAADRQRSLFEATSGMEELAATRDRDAPVDPAVWRLLADPH